MATESDGSDPSTPTGVRERLEELSPIPELLVGTPTGLWALVQLGGWVISVWPYSVGLLVELVQWAVLVTIVGLLVISAKK